LPEAARPEWLTESLGVSDGLLKESYLLFMQTDPIDVPTISPASGKRGDAFVALMEVCW